MFCQKCGNEISSGTEFCGYCGTQVKQSPMKNHQNPAPDYPAAGGRNTIVNTPNRAADSFGYYAGYQPEAIAFTEHPSREQSTINMHQQMGWMLKNSQEINTSTTHVYGNSYAGSGHVYSFVEKHHYVKLTFERNRNHPNYPVLKRNYDRFSELAARIIDLEASVERRKPLFYILCCIPALLAIILGFSTMGGFGFIIVPLALALVVPVMLIANQVAMNVRKNQIKPEVEELYAQMQRIANETEPYVNGAPYPVKNQNSQMNHRNYSVAV